MSTVLLSEKKTIPTVRLDPADGDKDLFLRAWLKGSGNPTELRSCKQLNLDHTEPRIRLIFSPERRSLHTDFSQSGGYTTQEMFITGYSLAMRQTFPFFDLVTRTAAPPVGSISWPWASDAIEADIIPNDEYAVEFTSDTDFGATMLYPKVFHSRDIRASRRWIQITPNAASRIGEMLGKRIGRKMGREFTVGAGVSAPRGFTLSTQTVAADSAVAIVRDDLLELLFSVPAEYRTAPNAAFQCHSTIAKSLMEQTDGQGQPLDMVTVVNGQYRMVGHRLVLNDFMDSSLASGKRTVAFGDWSQFIVAETPLEIQRLDELYAEQNQVGFIGRVVSDGGLVDPKEAGTVKVLVH